MSLSLSVQSINDAAKKRAQRALVNVELAEEQLKSANQTLEKAIPEGDIDEIQSAHEETKEAEGAVAKAHADLEVVETLLDAAVPVDKDAPAKAASGEGLKSLMKLLQQNRA